MYAFFFAAFKPADDILSMEQRAQDVQETGMQPKQNVKHKASEFCSSCGTLGAALPRCDLAWCEMDVPALWQMQIHTWISASPELGEEYFVG